VRGVVGRAELPAADLGTLAESGICPAG